MILENIPTWFGELMAYMASAAAKPVDEHTARVYWDCLRDIPQAVLEPAVKRAVCEQVYATLPPVATIRRFALEVTHGTRLAAHEAQNIAGRAIRKAGGPYAEAEDMAKALAEMPPEVAGFVRRFGWTRIADADDPEIFRGQWRMAWDAAQSRDRQVAALPVDLRPAIAGTVNMPRIDQMFRLPPGIAE